MLDFKCSIAQFFDILTIYLIFRVCHYFMLFRAYTANVKEALSFILKKRATIQNKFKKPSLLGPCFTLFACERSALDQASPEGIGGFFLAGDIILKIKRYLLVL